MTQQLVSRPTWSKALQNPRAIVGPVVTSHKIALIHACLAVGGFALRCKRPVLQRRHVLLRGRSARARLQCRECEGERYYGVVQVAAMQRQLGYEQKRCSLSSVFSAPSPTSLRCPRPQPQYTMH
jgi:hypothetical protein